MLAPFLVQVMAWLVPTSHFSRPVLGAVMVKLPLIARLESEISKTVVSLINKTLTLTVEDMASGTVQAYGEAVGSKPVAITFAGGNVVPPSVE